MSRTGFSASNYLKLDAGIITAVPLTIAAWIRDTTTNMSGTIAGVTTSSATTNRHDFLLNLNSGQVRAQSADGSGASAAVTANEMAANTWHHACGVISATNARAAYLDGDLANKGTNTGSRTPVGINRTCVGIDYASTPGNELDSTAAQVADLCFWNIALSDAEVVALAKGAHPFLIHPEAIVAYFPLVGRYSPEINLKSNSSVLTVQGTLSRGDSHPRVFSLSSHAVRKFRTGGTAQTINAGLTTETDTSQTIRPLRTRAVGLTTETESAQTVRPVEAHAAGLASETDSAQAVAHYKVLNLGLATETDSAQTVRPVEVHPAGLASETDSAQTVVHSIARTAGLASETDAAQSVQALRTEPVGLASETDSAQAVTLRRTVHTGQAEEFDSSLHMVGPVQTGLADETDEAQAVTGLKLRAVGLTTEDDTAQAAARLKTRTTGAGTEADAALQARAVRTYVVGMAAEGDEAQPVQAVHLVVLDLAEELDEAFGFETTQLVQTATETDTALSIRPARVIPAGLAAEADLALVLTSSRSRRAARRGTSSNEQPDSSARSPNEQTWERTPNTQ